ncbi:LytTR family DNA-binding domain-containing protein [Sulfuriflexus sp.]|uniref:LytR/AlgR family response regulator transcription factor n=1 Tax=Sulfuriflexus sp. TaxID=2015443 RepID=UPI0028CC8F90|nr:LytTR family DNA-binding domain-containing protein [Sulfuriflexus sp.]MDT8404447.1 LytTR family DNA-binding domain-containing protein [Sulfuriflexus sp.]
MKLLIVDDEALARERLRSLLADLDASIEVVGEAATGQQAIDQARHLHPDVVLLDIRMPGMDGIEASRHLNAFSPPPAIIFTTAYDEHALAAFEANAVGYLLKPVKAERLQQSLATASSLHKGQLQALQESRQDKARSHIGVRMRGDLRLIPVNEICYLRAGQKYVELRYVQGETNGTALIEESLKTLEEEFSEQFVRVHRNALVALECISGLEKDSLGRVRVRLNSVDDKLDVSRRHVAAVRKLLKARG